MFSNISRLKQERNYYVLNTIKNDQNRHATIAKTTLKL